MDHDSLIRHRMNSLRNQPNTLRGRSIVWLAKMDQRPVARLLLYLLFVLYVAVHLLIFVFLLRANLLDVSSFSKSITRS